MTMKKYQITLKSFDGDDDIVTTTFIHYENMVKHVTSDLDEWEVDYVDDGTIESAIHAFNKYHLDKNLDHTYSWKMID